MRNGYLMAVLAVLVALPAGGAQPSSRRPGPSVQPTPNATNQPPEAVFGTRRLSNSGATEMVIRQLFRGIVRLLPDDRIEATYNFTTPDQLMDFAAQPGSGAPSLASGPWVIRDGALQKVAPDDVPIFHRVRFQGPLTITFKSAFTKGPQCAAGYFNSGNNAQLLAGLTRSANADIAAFLAQETNIVAQTSNLPANVSGQVIGASFAESSFSFYLAGQPLLTARRAPPPSSVGQVFIAAPDSSVTIDDLQLVGRLDLEWFRGVVDSQVGGYMGPRYGPPPANEAQMRQMLRGFQRTLPDGRIELAYDFASPAQIADWQAIGPRNQVDPLAWQAFGGGVRKCQLGPVNLVLQPPLLGQIKVTARAAIISGSETSLGLRNVTGTVRCGFGTGNIGFFLREEGGKGRNAAASNIQVKQSRALELIHDAGKISARLDEGPALSADTRRGEPFNVVLEANNSIATFNDVRVTGFLDRDWCMKRLRPGK